MSKFKLSQFAVLILILTAFQNCKNEKMNRIKIEVNSSKVLYTMQGGMGASWHAIKDVFPLNNEKYKIKVRETAPLGSAYGGNPPVSDKLAWEQIKNHASWLGMNFLRVELSQHMYNPEKSTFDWENEEMLALYNILDWAEENDADVFLQQMCANVEWNAFPGIHPLISAPKDLNAHANAIATLIEFLTKEKGYSCIKYFCMTNEPPGGTWGYWWEYGENEGKIEDAWARLKQEFENRGIQVPISGPDWTDIPPFDESKLEMAKYFGAIDIHTYHGITSEKEETLKSWAEWSHKQGKPFFLTEYGNMNLGWGGDDPNQKSFAAALSNANDVMRGMRNGVDGFNRWSFTNRGDLDGQWQLIHTFDRENKIYRSQINPEPEAYYGFGIISRFLSKYSAVLKTEVQAPDSVVVCNAVKSPDGKITLFVLNNTEKEQHVEVEFSGQVENDFYLYQVNKEIVNTPGFRLNPKTSLKSAKKINLTLPPKSISALSQNLLNESDKGVFLN